MISMSVVLRISMRVDRFFLVLVFTASWALALNHIEFECQYMVQQLILHLGHYRDSLLVLLQFWFDSAFIWVFSTRNPARQRSGHCVCVCVWNHLRWCPTLGARLVSISLVCSMDANTVRARVRIA